MRRLVFDQSSPVHPVSESRGGSQSVTYERRTDGRTEEILVSNFGFNKLKQLFFSPNTSKKIISCATCHMSCFMCHLSPALPLNLIFKTVFMLKHLEACSLWMAQTEQNNHRPTSQLID